MSIMEKARSLGEAIVESSEYHALKKAETNMYENKEAKTLLDEFSAKQKRLQMAQSNGKKITEEDQKELQAIQVKMQGNEKVKDFMQAQEKFNNVMQTVNQTISSVMSGDNSQDN